MSVEIKQTKLNKPNRSLHLQLTIIFKEYSIDYGCNFEQAEHWKNRMFRIVLQRNARIRLIILDVVIAICSTNIHIYNILLPYI